MPETKSATPAPKARHVRVPQWMRWTMLAIIVVGSLVVGWFRIAAKSKGELAIARAAFAERGFPTRPVDIVPPPVPDLQNAEPLLREAWRAMSGSAIWDTSAMGTAFRKIDEINLRKNTTAKSSAEWVRENIVRIAEALREPEVVRCIATLHAAAERPQCRFALDYAQGINLELSHIGPLRSFVRLLSKRAVALALSAEAAGAAWEDLRVAWMISDWVDQEPTLISHLTAIAMRRIVGAHALLVLEHGHRPASLERMIIHARQSLTDVSRRFVRALHAERVLMFGALEQDLLKRTNWVGFIVEWAPVPPWVQVSHPWFTPVLSAIGQPRLHTELRTCHERYLEIAIATRTLDPGLVSRLAAIDGAMDADDRLLAKVIFSDLSKLGASHLASVSELRLLIAALVASERARDSATWPAALHEIALPKDETVDACSGQEIRLLRDDDTLLIYAFGLDGDDDGGRVIWEVNSPADDGDIVVHLRVRHAD